MNRIYRVVFNRAAGVWQVASECARGCGKRSRTRRDVALAMLVAALGGAAPAAAQLVMTQGSVSTAADAFSPLTPAPVAPPSPWNLGGSYLYVGGTRDTAGTGLVIIGPNGQVVDNPGVFKQAWLGATARSTGTVHIAGENALWRQKRGDIVVGGWGRGFVSIGPGGMLDSSAVLLGERSTGSGSLEVKGAGARWNSESLVIGNEGHGTVTVSDGGTAVNGSTTIGYIHEGRGTGELRVMGKGSSWTSSAEITVGAYGSGTLTVENGATVSSRRGGVGGFGVGTATVSGAGSAWRLTDELAIGANNEGSLRIEAGGEVAISSLVRLGSDAPGSGTLHLLGDAQARGVLRSAGLVRGKGQATLDLDGGILRAAADQAEFFQNLPVVALGAGGLVFDTNGFDVATGAAFGSDAGGLLKQGLGTLTLTGESRLGGAVTVNAGTLAIQGAGKLAGLSGYIGRAAGSRAVATLAGAGTAWTTGSDGELHVGDAGRGDLLVAAGAALSSGWTRIGAQGRGEGKATVTGAGTSWTVAKDLSVGHDGVGALTIADGASMLVQGTAASVGVSAGFKSTATVTGPGSQWVSRGILRAGRAGTGDVQVEAGGLAAGARVRVGEDAAGKGSVTVTGRGSRVTSMQEVLVGSHGTGTLEVTQGGAVSGDWGMLGDQATGIGTATVSGKDALGQASAWTSARQLIVGQRGRGTLSVDAGGLVQTGAKSALTLASEAGSTGTLHLRGDDDVGRGVLATSRVVRGQGAATLDLDGGILRATANQSEFFENFPTVALGARGLVFDTNGFNVATGTAFGSDEGDLVKQGAGTLTLAGESRLGGSVAVDAGTLAIDAGGLVQTGADRVVHLARDAGSSGSLHLRGDTGGGRGVLATSQIVGGQGTATLDLDGGVLRATADQSEFFQNLPIAGVGARGLVFDTNGFNVATGTAFGGGGGGALVKQGAGTLTLTGASDMGQPGTRVDAGTLRVDGTLGGNVEVNVGGTLGGTGTVGSAGGTVRVNSGGTLAPGHSPGTLNIGGDLVLAAGSTTQFELGQAGTAGGPNNDLVNVGGNLALGGSLQANAASAGWYRLFNYGTTDGTGQRTGSFDAAASSVRIGGDPAASYNITSTPASPGTPGQVNLSVQGAGQTIQFWNGGNSADPPGWVGGSGIWQGGGSNWLDKQADGPDPDLSRSVGWGNSVAVFGGARGDVRVQGDVGFDTLQFLTDGYTIGAAPGQGSLVIAPAADSPVAPRGTINTMPGVQASISAPIVDSPGASNGLITTGSGTLTLSGTNTYSGGTFVEAGTLVAASDRALGSGIATVSNAALRVDAGVALGNSVRLRNGATLDNAGTLSAAGTAVDAHTDAGAARVVNRDGGRITGSGPVGTAVLMAGAGSSVANSQASVIHGDSVGVHLSLGGSVTNDGQGSVISGAPGGSAMGVGVLSVGGEATIRNTGGARISGAGTGVAVQGGGTVTNEGAGSAIEGGTSVGVGILGAGAVLNNRAGAVISGGVAGVAAGRGARVNNDAGRITASGTDSSGVSFSFAAGALDNRNGGVIEGTAQGVQMQSGGSVVNEADSTIGATAAGGASILSGGATVLRNAGTLRGSVRLADSARHAVTLASGGRIAGDLETGRNSASTLTLEAAAGARQRQSDAVAGNTAFAGELVKEGAGTWVLDRDLDAVSTRIAAGTLQLGEGGAVGRAGTGPIAIAKDASLAVDRSNALTLAGAISGEGALQQLGRGTTTLTGDNSYAGGTTIRKGTVAVGSSTALGTGTVRMDDGTTLAFAADRLTLANAIVFTGEDDPVFDTGPNTAILTGGISGNADLTKTGSGTLVLGAANNRYTGATNVAQGTLRAGAAGALSAASAHTISVGAMLDLAGLNQTVAGIANAGTVSLRGGRPGTTLTVTGPWVGQGGVLAVGTTLGTDNSLSDRLLLSGPRAVASGNTLVQVTNVGGLGGQTTGKGIEVVGTEGGARIQGGAFALAAPVLAGAYEYHLDSTAEGAYLSNTLPSQPPSPPSPPPGPAPAPAPAPRAELPTYRAEVPLYAALPEQLRQASLGMLANHHQRIGDDGGHPEAGQRQAWGRVISIDRETGQGGTVGASSRGRLTGLQAGTDLWADSAWKAGIYVGQLEGDMQVKGFARGVWGLAAGNNDLRSQFLGGYLTWRGSDGLYVDGVIQAGRHRYTASPGLGASSGGKGHSLLASIEVGRSWDIAPGWQIEPQLQLIHQRLRLDGASLIGATTVQQDLHNGWQARIGVRVKGDVSTSAGPLRPYARVNVQHARGGTDRTRFVAPGGLADIFSGTGGTSTELAAGATWQLTPAVSVYGELGKLWASGGQARTRSGVNGSLGVKLRW